MLQQHGEVSARGAPRDRPREGAMNDIIEAAGKYGDMLILARARIKTKIGKKPGMFQGSCCFSGIFMGVKIIKLFKHQ